MIILPHIPRTAGTSFRTALSTEFGPRLLHDDNEEVEISNRKGEGIGSINISPKDIENNYSVIVGHYTAETMRSWIPQHQSMDISYGTFFRHPMERILSHYFYFRKIRLGGGPASDPRKVHDGLMDVFDFATSETPKDLFYRYIKPLKISELGFIGFSDTPELYAKSIQLFNRAYGTNLNVHHVNKTFPKKYEDILCATGLSNKYMRHMHKVHSKDFQIYREAKDRFFYLCKKYGIL